MEITYPADMPARTHPMAEALRSPGTLAEISIKAGVYVPPCDMPTSADAIRAVS